MPTAGLIEKDLEICRISTGQLLCSCAQVNIEQNVIQFLVLLYIMDRETETDRQTDRDRKSDRVNEWNRKTNKEKESISTRYLKRFFLKQ